MDEIQCRRLVAEAGCEPSLHHQGLLHRLCHRGTLANLIQPRRSLLKAMRGLSQMSQSRRSAVGPKAATPALAVYRGRTASPLHLLGVASSRQIRICQLGREGLKMVS